MFISIPLWGPSSTHMPACLRKRRLQRVYQWPCSNEITVYCICSTSLAGIDLWCLVGDKVICIPLNFLCKIRYFCAFVSRIRSPRRDVWKDSDTSATSALTVLWRSLNLFVVPNWFLRTDTANYDTSVVLDLCWSPSRNLYLTPTCVRNVYHIFQLPD